MGNLEIPLSFLMLCKYILEQTQFNVIWNWILTAVISDT